MGAVLSSALMLDHLGHAEAGRALEQAVVQAARDGQTTPDIGGSLTTSQVGDLLARAVASRVPAGR
jgi:3-isopropylmalate dehydrogenase